MKKIISLIAVCIAAFSLSACGSEETLTQFESDKLTYAEDMAANNIVPSLSYFMGKDLEAMGLPLSEYTMEEVGYLANAAFSIDADGYGFYNAISSFQSAVDELGEITNIGEATGYIDGQQIVVNVAVDGSKREGTAEVIFTNDQFLKLKSASLNANYSMSEKMSKAGLNTIIGISSVFLVLILISLLIGLFGYIPKIEKAMQDKKNAKKATEQGIDNAVNQIVQAEEVADESDDTELVAVIAAAIAAYEGSASTDGFVVRSIKKIKR